MMPEIGIVKSEYMFNARQRPRKHIPAETKQSYNAVSRAADSW
jgi:hypothetical protein